MSTEDDGTRKYWTDLRVFSVQTTESGVPSASASGWVTVDWSGNLPDEIEIRFGTLTTTGSPTSVTFHVWRKMGTTIDRLHSYLIYDADLYAPIPINLKFDAELVYVTAELTGGSSPKVSGTLQYRIIK